MDPTESKQWIWPGQIPADVKEGLASYSHIEQQLLFRREILSDAQADAFLKTKLGRDDDPFQIKGMQKAVDRILVAKQADEKVFVYGDYDADGITATVVLMEALREIGLDPSFYIPDRMTEGYGLHSKALEALFESGAQLVITVDCGIRAIEEATKAQSLGLDLIVTDHHAPGPHMPDVEAIINPKQPDDSYPFSMFAGVGLAYKLAQALMISLGEDVNHDLLELVAIGTIADLAPLKDENRYLVSAGLERINETHRIGIKELLEVARADNKPVTADTIGFAIGPRINAAGRLEDAAHAVQLLLTKESSEAKRLAQELDEINRRRQKLTGVIVEQARQQVFESIHDSELIFTANKDFHEGIVGLAASRLSDEFFRPAIVATLGDEFTRGSARSIPGFHITQAFESCADILVQYGGHSAAAGFTVRTSDVKQLRQRLEQLTDETLRTHKLQPTIEIDAEVSFFDITSDLLNFVERLQPCGIGNHSPLFGAKNIQVISKRNVGRGGSHLKMMLKGDGRLYDAIAFRKGALTQNLPDFIDLVFKIERNVYMGYENIQLNVQEIAWS